VGKEEINSHRGGFTDVWLDYYHEPLHGSKDEWDRYHALTFPCCNPVQRIDFIMYREGSSGGGGDNKDWTAVRPQGVEVVGQRATDDTEGKESQGGGMLDDDSPIWASDHRAVIADFTLYSTNSRNSINESSSFSSSSSSSSSNSGDEKSNRDGDACVDVGSDGNSCTV